MLGGFSPVAPGHPPLQPSLHTSSSTSGSLGHSSCAGISCFLEGDELLYYILQHTGADGALHPRNAAHVLVAADTHTVQPGKSTLEVETETEADSQLSWTQQELEVDSVHRDFSRTVFLSSSSHQCLVA